MAEIFIVYLVAMLVWSLGSFMMRTGLFPGPLVWNRIMVCGTLGIPFIFFHFTKEILERPRLKLLVGLGYGFYCFFLAANFLGLIVREASLEGGFSYSLGPLAQAFGAVGGVYILLSALLLVREGVSNPSSFWSHRLVYPSVGAVLMLCGSVLNLLPPVGKYPLDIATNTANAFLLTYAIYRYRLLNVSITLRKGVVYTVLTICLTGAYLLLVFVLEQLVRARLGYSTLIVAVPVAAIIAFFFEPAKEALRVWVDKAFFGQQYGYRETLKAFSHIMTSILNLDELAVSTLDLVTKAFQAETSLLLLPDRDGNFCAQATIGREAETGRGVRMDRTSPILRWLAQRPEPLLFWEEVETLPEFQGLWQGEREMLESIRISVLAGIRIKRDLIGVLLLSQKSSGDPYTKEDLELLLTVANEAAVAINNARLYCEARTQATRDELTGLYNYRFFQEFLDKEVEHSRRTGQSLSVIFIDVDHFKAYNDVYGHLAGDEALGRLAEAVSGSIRAADVAARYGGDEFAVLLPGAGSSEALRVAERIMRAVQRCFSGTETGSGLLTVSLGVASYPEHSQSKQELLTAADSALYQAKYSGRDRICVFGRAIGAGDADGGSPGEESSASEKGFLKRQLEEAYLATVYTLAAAINARDNYTFKHSEMVTYYALGLAEALGLSEERRKIVRFAAMLHDIGKIGIPEYILNKPGGLTPPEREAVKRHVHIAEAIVRHTPYLRPIAPIILHHHEAYDGKGYPDGLQGEEIPLEARILAIADAYHAMTSDRPYRPALSREQAVGELRALAGKQFDPTLVPVFIRLLARLGEVGDPDSAAAGGCRQVTTRAGVPGTA
ncbi:MAG: diguanylate cyclase [Moorellales bacterium]